MDNNFHALTNKNYRYYWIGQFVSLIGTWMQSTGQAWLVYTLTDSPMILGVLGLMQFLPVTILSLFAGVFVDKYSKKKILLATQSVSMVLALILAVLVFTNAVRYEYILILAFLQGITNAIDLPARQTFVFEIVGRKNLMNALALNSVIQNLARIMGPAIAAALMATVGAGWCFFVNALSFMALIVGLIRMKVIPYVRGEISNNVFCEIKDGLRYMYNNRILFQTLLMVLVIGTFSCNYNVLMPVFVKDILHQGAEGFGILMAAMGIGSLIGALTISGKNRSNPSMTVMLFSALIIGVLYALIGFIAPYAAILVFFAMIGTFGIYFATTANAMLQVNSTDQYRGRIISVYCMVFAGAIPVGSLLSGLVIDNLGITPAFKLTGILIICLIIIIFLVFLRPWVLKKASNGNKYRCKK